MASNRMVLGPVAVRRRVADVPSAHLLWEGRFHQRGLFAVRLDEPVGYLATRARQRGHNGGAIRAADEAGGCVPI